MKTQTRFSLLGVAVVILLLINACSKENDIETQSKEAQKTNAVGNKVFTGNIIQKVFANNDGKANFANNSGNMNFTGSGLPGPGGGSHTGSGSFTYDNQIYPLFFGGYVDYEDGWIEIVFADQVFDLDEDPYDINAVAFEIRSGSSNEISAGHYSYSHSEHPFTFDWAGIVIHLNTSQEEYYDFIGGDLTISKSGNVYSFTFSGILENGKSISGYFSGGLTDLDPDPVPIPTAVMYAQVNGIGWNAITTYAQKDVQNNELLIHGVNSLGQEINLVIYTDHISAGYWEIDGAYYANYANVNITQNTGTLISGTFNFTAENIYGGTTVNVTNGVFSNVPLSEY